jgi:hypothetical protein
MALFRFDPTGERSNLAPLLIAAAVVVALLAAVFWVVGSFMESRTIIVRPALRDKKGTVPPVILSKEGVIIYTNKARLENGGFTPLTENALLNAVATERMNDMIEKQYFAHISPTGESAADAAQKVGYKYDRIGENIAEGLFVSDDKLVQGWMQSPGHRKNILSDQFAEIGVAVAKGRVQGEEVWVAVQIFGRQSPPVSDQAPAPAVRQGKQLWDSCIRPDEALLAAINRTKAEAAESRTYLEEMRWQIESMKPTVENRQGGDSGALAAEYNAKVQDYNRQIQEAKSKDAQFREMVARYNAEVERYNACAARK